MKLIDELKEKRADARDRMSECLTNASSYEELASIAREHIADLDRAIAALTPQDAPDTAAQETFDFEASASAALPSNDDCPVPGAGEESRDHFETTDSDPDAGFDAPDGETHFDAAAEAAARDPVLRAFEDDQIIVPAPLIDAQTCEPVDARVAWEVGPRAEDASVFGDAPAPAPDGYSPVTNPEADALAAARNYYSPEAQIEREREESFLNRFNPFRVKADA